MTPPTQVQTSSGVAGSPGRGFERGLRTNARNLGNFWDSSRTFRRFLDKVALAPGPWGPDAAIAAYSGRVLAVPALDTASAQRV